LLLVQKFLEHKILQVIILYIIIISFIFYNNLKEFQKENKKDLENALFLCQTGMEQEKKYIFNISLCAFNDIDKLLKEGLESNPLPADFIQLRKKDGILIDRWGCDIEEEIITKLILNEEKIVQQRAEMIQAIVNSKGEIIIIAVVPFTKDKLEGWLILGNKLSDSYFQKQINIKTLKVGIYLGNKKIIGTYYSDLNNLSPEIIKELEKDNIVLKNFNIKGIGYYGFIYPLKYRNGEFSGSILCAIPADPFSNYQKLQDLIKSLLIISISMTIVIYIFIYFLLRVKISEKKHTTLSIIDSEDREVISVENKKTDDDTDELDEVKKYQATLKINQDQLDLITQKLDKAQAYIETLKKTNEEYQVNKQQLELVNIKFKKARAELENMDKIKAQFLSNINHEFRTPVALIISFAEILLADKKLDEEQKGIITDIYNASARLKETVDNILALPASIEEKRDKIKTDINLHQIIEKVKKNFKSEIEKKKLNININLSENIPSSINVQEVSLEHILNNLLSNAVKFTGHNGTIIIKAEITKTNPYGGLKKDDNKKENYLNVSITDNGIGIKPQDQQKLFQREFWQADSSSTREYEGSGLGLIITKKLVEEIDGTIWFYSKEGEGSTFGFVISIKSEE